MVGRWELLTGTLYTKLSFAQENTENKQRFGKSPEAPECSSSVHLLYIFRAMLNWEELLDKQTNMLLCSVRAWQCVALPV